MKKMSKGVKIELSPEALTWFELELPQAPDGPDVDTSDYDPEADPEFVGSYLKLEFVEELRNIMYERGINGSELARMLGKSRQAVSKALDKEDPDNFTIEKMAELVTAVGARISIKVHEPGTMMVSKPVHVSRPVRVVPIDMWHPGKNEKTQAKFARSKNVFQSVTPDTSDYTNDTALIPESDSYDEEWDEQLATA